METWGGAAGPLVVMPGVRRDEVAIGDDLDDVCDDVFFF